MKKSIQIITLPVFLIISSFCFADSEKEGRKTPLLLHHGQLLRSSVADAYIYALSDIFDRTSQMADQSFIERLIPLPLCNTENIRQITPRMLHQECRIFHYSIEPSCQDINGCVEFKVHSSLQDDEELYELLIQVIRNPCAYIPTGKGFHWVGLFHPNFLSYKSLNCGKDRLPYSKAFITFGDTRVEVEL